MMRKLYFFLVWANEQASEQLKQLATALHLEWIAQYDLMQQHNVIASARAGAN